MPRKAEYKLDKRKNRVRIPEESVGLCFKCQRFGLLGNNICQTCWDRGKRGMPNESQIEC